MVIQTEIDVVYHTCVWLEKQGWKTKVECPNMGQSIDIVAMKYQEIWAIEAKLTDWKKAIEQCITHTIIADYISIVVAQNKISDNFLNAINNNENYNKDSIKRFGILKCDKESGEIKLIKTAQKQEYNWQRQKDIFIEKFNPVEYWRDSWIFKSN